MTFRDYDAGSVLVVGYGNILRGDDAAGWRVVETISDEPRCRSLQTIALHQLTVDLLEDMRHASVVIFVDASLEVAPGRVVTREVVPAGKHELGHRLTPAALAAMAETLYGEPVVAYEVLIGGSAFGFGDEISARVSAAIPAAVDAVLAVACADVEAAHQMLRA